MTNMENVMDSFINNIFPEAAMPRYSIVTLTDIVTNMLAAKVPRGSEDKMSSLWIA